MKSDTHISRLEQVNIPITGLIHWAETTRAEPEAELFDPATGKRSELLVCIHASTHQRRCCNSVWFWFLPFLGRRQCLSILLLELGNCRQRWWSSLNVLGCTSRLCSRGFNCYDNLLKQLQCSSLFPSWSRCPQAVSDCSVYCRARQNKIIKQKKPMAYKKVSLNKYSWTNTSSTLPPYCKIPPLFSLDHCWGKGSEVEGAWLNRDHSE